MKKTILLVIILLFSFGVVRGERTAEMKAEIVVNADTGWPIRLVISGYNPQDAAWLGMSLYPYGITDIYTGGRHSSIELKKGEFRQEILLDAALLDGSFEVGLWGKKVIKIDCTLDYCYWCKMNGFHVEQSLGYKRGYLTRLNGYK